MKKFLMLCSIAVLMPLAAFSATYYDAGNQMFSFKVGTTIPAFTYFISDQDFVSGLGEGNTGLSVGGYGSISYQVFSSPTTAIGGEIGYDFNYSAEEELFTAVPFFAKATYFPVQGVLDLPISVGLGGAYIKYGDGSLMTLYANIEIGLTWYPSTNWGFGINTGLWIIPELNYTEEIQSDNAIFGLIPVTLSVTYRQ
ncbi:hypothetical protein SpiGrapes_0369 [Sphaerochaeta pleomorpha str. Grapes]|uniref:Outer membrane protein beta-barrel domain-containing protein n=1 Tax=Sphaerochaeta pleomorpha (strain ATCC BAA-1885 / DSM 22778 / Grapes) TaxID=158190 RepID=G8QVJ4_SPHPG|nr:hypothetical protein [Sphaerochaeta pleomorpha]AEV28227.1 hypothetical protein SpiGrapes_0369 [Sphaerochaeta pleomorpha str. Grapes]